MNHRILTIVNMTLVLACAGCIYYLATARYRQPAELRGDWQSLGDLPEQTVEGANTLSRHSESLSALDKDFMKPVYTPTPTPTPTPRPTPKPPQLGEAMNGWQITSMSTDRVEIQTKQGETVTMSVGESPRTFQTQRRQAIHIELIDVNTDNLTATFGYEDQRHTLKF